MAGARRKTGKSTRGIHRMMDTTAANINQLWATLMVEELARHGITEYCLSPGSRNTPLTIAAARHPRTNCHIHFDERGSAFRALGYARATGMPAVLICTSGTAGANYYPAVIEAWQSRLPMLVLTANRPPELWDTGANQTIDQMHLFGRYVRWFHQFSCPSHDVNPVYVLSTIDGAVSHAMTTPAGPVHVDCPFPEPLAPIDAPVDFADYLQAVGVWLDAERPLTVHTRSDAVSQPGDLDRLAADLNESEHGLLIVGRPDTMTQLEPISRLATRLNWPVIADIQSGLRFGQQVPQRIAYADLILAARTGEQQPVTVLHLGEQPTSKRLHQYLSRIPTTRYVHVTSHNRGSDPNHVVTERVTMDLAPFCDLILPLITTSSNAEWLSDWQSQSHAVEDILRRELDDTNKLTEASVARAVARCAPEGTGLWAASSMPIRDLDSFVAPNGPRLQVGANRGASGIDGTIASACGFGAGLDKSVTLLIGDLAALHDLNSLAMMAKSKQPVITVAINNDGGGIFQFLPVAECDDVFESFFGTPHGLTFASAAAQFGLAYASPGSNDELIESIERLHGDRQSAIVEVRSDRQANLEHHRSLLESIRKELRGG
ncbi:2-succinyl-5-enolpyruvyl-6-hydroxy-3-cyclohexene-1-carboxylic-acid synthase [candidate division GN15 bacterium]|nr:2-succinyl-5-enolpyruvyl-6-hydroxy-3-cyclohexene-1-carboxylic-acid synthase [candidate division GN15 bacterium]